MNLSPVRVVIHGASGRMGQELLRVVAHFPQIEIATALVRPGSTLEGESLRRALGHMAPDVEFSSALDPDLQADVFVDFSRAHAFDGALALALERRLAFISGTTGLSHEQFVALEHAAHIIPVLWGANFSLGVAMLTMFAKQAAQKFPDWDCEIVETHHNRKQDVPSGTALHLAQVIAESRKVDFKDKAIFGRYGRQGIRPSDEIGIHSLRCSDVVGEHTMVFAGEGERIELVHRATSRDIFARGALEAALWLSRQPAGRYTMDDVVSRDSVAIR